MSGFRYQIGTRYKCLALYVLSVFDAQKIGLVYFMFLSKVSTLHWKHSKTTMKRRKKNWLQNQTSQINDFIKLI